VELDRFRHLGHRLSEAVGEPGALGDIIHGCVHDLLLLHGLLAQGNGDEPRRGIIPPPHYPLAGGVPRASARGPSRVRRGERVLEEPNDLAVQGPAFVLSSLLQPCVQRGR
jgi:hypothetical protein